MQAFQSNRAVEAVVNRSASFSSLELELLDLEQTVAAYLNGYVSRDSEAQAYYRSSRINRLVIHACQK
jgi:hypothetical protein